jgi:YafQ family addiction module toxin component/addiction module RelB/DinJ family antitoxin
MEVKDMAKTSTIRARIEPTLKEDVEKLFKKMGLSTTEAINLFYRQVKLRNGLPFNVVIPNKTTEKVFKDTDANRNLIRCEDAEDMFDKLGIWMRIPSYTKQFAKDLKRMEQRGKPPEKIKNIIKKLVDEERLDVNYKDHKLIGNYKGRRECHVEPDWLLIYKIIDSEIIFERTGTHSDLFE